MKKMKLRLAAILTALVMALGLMPALAEQPAAPSPMAALMQTIEQLYASGKSMQTEYTITVNPALGNMLMGVTGQQPDEANMALLTTVINAVNKLKAVVMTGKEQVSGTVGTDQASLFDFQVALNEETKANHITTSLLPGIALSIDPEMLSKMSPASKMTPEQMQQLMAPYLAAFSAYTAKVAQAAAKEEGTYEIAGYGTYTTRYQLAVTTHMAASLLEDVAALYKSDENLQRFFEEAMKANQAMDLPTEGEVPQDPAQAMLDAAKDIKAKEDKVILNATVYEDGAGKSYAELVTPEGNEQAFRIDLLMTGAPVPGQAHAGPVDISAKILMKTNQPAATGETIPATDWVALESDIKSGTNYTDALVNLTFKTTPELPQINSAFSLNLLTSGMNIGLAGNSASNLGTLEESGQFHLSFMTPDPMLTVNFTSKPVDAQPAAPLLDGASTVVLSEGELPEETNKLLENSLQQALPALLERLKAALPEEAPALLALLEADTSQGPMVEPEVVEEAPVEPEVSEEVPAATEEAPVEPEVTEEVPAETATPNP